MKLLPAAKLIALLLLVGLLSVGYAYYESWRKDVRFSRNVRCTGLARDFARSRTTDPVEPLIFDSIYSSKRGSCLAVIEHQTLGRRLVVQVADPVTGEVMWVEGCSIDGECTAFAEPQMRIQAERYLDTLADKPLDRPAPH
jgi:hypothetical protein